MKSLFVSAALVAALAAAPVLAQDAKPSNDCPLAGVFCKKDGKCEGKCKEVCQRGAAALKAVQARVGELMKKEAGCACACTSGACTEKACASCDAVKTKVMHPVLKERAAARFGKDGFKETKHVAKVDGKDVESGCTFLSGETCTTCVHEMADAAWAKLKELFSSKDCGKPVR